MYVTHGRMPGKPSGQRGANFTGTVHMDPVMDTGDVVVNTVLFTPGAHTFWHVHPGGQLLIVTAGRGLVATRSGQVQVVTAGDVVWTEPGEEHWHGGCASSLMTHLAVSHGPTQWGTEVDATDYTSANAATGR
jgi:quercetin dioxygenase-like cupin family protein